MKRRNFTLLIVVLIATGLNLNAQTSPEGSTGWDNLLPVEQLLLDMNFQEYPFFHADSNPDQGNSTYANPEGVGYMDTKDFRTIYASTDSIFLDFYQCAFAPEWIAAYAYKDSVDMPAGITPGFVEISREYESHLTVNGHLIIDCRQLSFIEVVQYSHSSCGGNKRGFTFSAGNYDPVGDSIVWDTIRAQGSNYGDDNIGELAASFNCQLSAFGMRWEDGIWDSYDYLRFTKPFGFSQAVRLHDLRIYGLPEHSTIGISDIHVKEIGIECYNKTIRLSETADIGIYDLSGKLLRRADNITTYNVNDLPEGLYIVRAKTDSQTTTNKVLIK